jgi:3-methyladenine DNA glycosylase AlkC
MSNLNPLINRVKKTQHGFTDIKLAATEVLENYSAKDSFKLARELFDSDVHQARMLAVFIAGALAADSKPAFNFLYTHASRDEDWRVQEILAQAFDQYCAGSGYEKSLPVIQFWLIDINPNVRRAVTEGLRIWTSKPYFREHAEVAISLLSQLRADESDYVRKSVGNALRDISRKHRDLVKEELETWDISDKNIQQVHKLAGKFL